MGPPDPVGECVQKCDKALADQDKVIELGRKVSATQDAVIAAQDKQITELSKNDGNIIKSPVFWLVVGVAGGLFLGGRK